MPNKGLLREFGNLIDNTNNKLSYISNIAEGDAPLDDGVTDTPEARLKYIVELISEFKQDTLFSSKRILEAFDED